MNDISEKKNQLRKHLVEQRANLPAEEVYKLSNEICDHVINSPEFKAANTIHVFIGSLPGEIKTDKIIDEALSLGKELIIPVIHSLHAPLSHSYLSSMDHLEDSLFGIAQPAKNHFKEAMPESADVIYVPGTGFDLSGNRLGMGGGFYDRFLKDIKTVKVGLGFQFQLVDEIPADSHDVPIDMIVTQKGIKIV